MSQYQALANFRSGEAGYDDGGDVPPTPVESTQRSGGQGHFPKQRREEKDNSRTAFSEIFRCGAGRGSHGKGLDSPTG